MVRWLARWRVALRIARRDAWRHRGRTALVVAMVALPLMAGTVLMAFIQTSQGTPEGAAARVLGPYAQAEVTQVHCRPFLQNPTATGGGCLAEVPDDPVPIDAATLREVLGVEHVVQLGQVWVDIVSDDAALTDHILAEVDDAAELSLLVATQDGRLPRSEAEIAMWPQLADRLAVELGDTVRLGRGEDSVDATLVGLLAPGNPQALVALTGTTPGNWAGADAADREPWLVLGERPVTWDDVLAANAQGWQVVSRAVLLDPPPDHEVPYLAAFPQPAGVDVRTVGLVGAVLAMGLLEVVLLVGPAFAIGARRSARQLAVVASVGGSPADTRRIVLATGVVSGAVAAIVGVAAGVLLSFVGMLLLIRLGGGGSLGDLVLPTWELALLAMVAVLLGVAAAWMPARAAARGDVVAALAGRRGEPRPARGVARLGVALGVLGMLGMLLAALASQPVGLVAGVVALEIGVVLMSGAIVVGVARIAPRLGVSGRFALRDSARHRSRTAPAVAAVLAAVAAATAGAIYLQGESTAGESSWMRLSDAPGLVLTYPNEDLADSAAEVGAALERLTDEVDVVAAVPVYGTTIATDPDTGEEIGPTMTGVQGAWVLPIPDPDLQCGDGSDDPRCHSPGGHASGFTFPGTIVDDGTLLEAAGLPGWEEAVAILESGGAVVDAYALWPDGTAHLTMASPAGDGATVEVPGFGSTWSVGAYSTVLSPEAAAKLGLVPVVVGGLVTTADELPQSEVDRLNGLIRQDSAALSLHADRLRSEGVPIALVLVAVATLVALAAVGLAVGLAGADTAPDMSTLSAIGAPPGVRRRIAAAQAGAIAGTGAVLGVLTGIPIGLALSLWGREQNGYGERWPLTVPWQVLLAVVVIPLVAMAATWLLTRSRLPLVRRRME